MRWIVPLVAALVPLLITPGVLSHFDVTPKLAILLLGSALIPFYWKTNVQNFYNLLRRPAGRWFAGLLAAAWISMAVATVFSKHAMLSLNGGGWRRLGLIPETALLLFAAAAGAWMAADSGNIRLLLRACAAAGAVSSGYGIAQYFGWDALLPLKAYEVGEGRYMIVRPPGTMGHADYFAAWLVAVVFLGIALARLETRTWSRWAGAGASAVAAIAIVLSGTRSAMLGLILGGIILLALARLRIGVRSLTAGALCAAMLALFFFSPAGLKLRARLHWSVEDAHGGARLLLWRDAIGMAAQRPLAGFGPETFSTEFARFESVALARAFPDFYHESPHNIFLDALTWGGILALLTLLGFCWLGAWCAAHPALPAKPLAAPLAAGLAGLMAAQQFIVFVIPVLLYFYLLIGLLVAITGATTEQQVRSVRFLYPRAVMATVSLLLVGYTCRLLIADTALAVAQRRIASGDAQRAAEAYRTVLRWQLEGTGDDLSYSRAMQELAARSPIFVTRLVARQEALEAAVRAVSSAEDRQNAWYNLATLLAANNDAAGVERALRNAIAWSPNWFKPHWMLAQLLALEGRGHEALQEAQTAVERDGGHDTQVAQTLETLTKSSTQGR
ncbi:MAG TPA: O-antigen ligase family protein [Bryobacteraceae bacterium]|nr:O-antigen ligase family protein [Bryobacteraceae bacterium]